MTTKRRKFSPEFKARVVLELISGEKGLMQASREYEIKDSKLAPTRKPVEPSTHSNKRRNNPPESVERSTH